MTRVTGQRRRLVLCVCVIGAVAFSACDGHSPTSPSSTTVTGTWTGSIASTLSGPATARVTLAQSGSSITGTWFVTSDIDPSAANSGTLSGTIAGSALSLTLTPSDPRTCPFDLTATVSGNRLVGTYAAFNCTVAISGAIDLTR